MEIKNNKGITLLTLGITVIVLAIIAGATISVSVDISETAKFENVETSLLLIQSKCKIIAEKYAIGDIKEEELYGTKQTEGEYSGWYLLSQEDLEAIGLEDLSANDNYYVDYTNDDVAYGKGVSYKENTFYKLSEILNYTGN